VDQDNNPIDLDTGISTVQFNLSFNGGASSLKTGTVLDQVANKGVVTYQLQDADIPSKGTLSVDVLITTTGGDDYTTFETKVFKVRDRL
jgi:hypothetical protein